MPYSAYCLLLYPQAETAGSVVPALQAAGMLGAMLDEGVFAVGEQFLQHICFLGCSPDIELEPHPVNPFCYVRVPVDDAEMAFRPIRKPLLRVRQWVLIGNVHEAEAVPDAALLDVLAAASGCRWKFAYLKP
ncbi:MAG: hypothetical protein JG718_10145 [Candidatus Thiothrix moscowensis]|nr:hypothetical protein [Candidatus Thiothrix moscowensis]